MCITRLGHAAFQSEADTQKSGKSKPIEKPTETKDQLTIHYALYVTKRATNDSIGRRAKATSSMRPHPFESD